MHYKYPNYYPPIYAITSLTNSFVTENNILKIYIQQIKASYLGSGLELNSDSQIPLSLPFNNYLALSQALSMSLNLISLPLVSFPGAPCLSGLSGHYAKMVRIPYCVYKDGRGVWENKVYLCQVTTHISSESLWSKLLKTGCQLKIQ